MKFFDIGQEATGFIAVGQIATGVIAIGQMATGVIAIGQLARGVVAVGMGAFGIVSVGMLAGGVVQATGMIGIAGMRGKGIVVPLMPFPRYTPFQIVPAAKLFAGRAPGFIRAYLTLDRDNTPALSEAGQVLPVDVAVELRQAARARAASSETSVVAYVEPSRERGGAWVAERLIGVPNIAGSLPLKLFIWALCFAALSGLSVAFYELVALPLLEALLLAK